MSQEKDKINYEVENDIGDTVTKKYIDLSSTPVIAIIVSISVICFIVAAALIVWKVSTLM